MVVGKAEVELESTNSLSVWSKGLLHKATCSATSGEATVLLGYSTGREMKADKSAAAELTENTQSISHCSLKSPRPVPAGDPTQRPVPEERPGLAAALATADGAAGREMMA
ncbi:unnamed protein product [Caretta caretta]